ncbi:dof zinc finger protein DOF3.1-like [Selaginella moellendorffii]|nr:dof zinc finger protein DOF3.1-like [Selaginella moellendorffii]|eukprot:XP_024523888.1 dof zinc finger protein DOF3.1-like [Selaginella moellendorffii]
MAKKSGSGNGAVVVKKRRARNERACQLTAQQVREQNLDKMWEPHELPDNVYQCPRCQSYNTRFDYYNNEKRDQPRFACRACKKQWTQGGKIRAASSGGRKRKGKASSSSSDGGGSMDKKRAEQSLVGKFAGEPSQTPWQLDGEDMQTICYWGQPQELGGNTSAPVVGGDEQNNFWLQPGGGGDNFWRQPQEIGGALQVGGDVQKNLEQLGGDSTVHGYVEDNFWDNFKSLMTSI